MMKKSMKKFLIPLRKDYNWVNFFIEYKVTTKARVRIKPIIFYIPR